MVGTLQITYMLLINKINIRLMNTMVRVDGHDFIPSYYLRILNTQKAT